MSSKQPSTNVALITGASRGIGKAIALEFAKAGIHVLRITSYNVCYTKLLRPIPRLAPVIKATLVEGCFFETKMVVIPKCIV